MERVTQKKNVEREVVSPQEDVLGGSECAAFSTWVVARLHQRIVPISRQSSFHPHVSTLYAGLTRM